MVITVLPVPPLQVRVGKRGRGRLAAAAVRPKKRAGRRGVFWCRRSRCESSFTRSHTREGECRGGGRVSSLPCREVSLSSHPSRRRARACVKSGSQCFRGDPGRSIPRQYLVHPNGCQAGQHGGGRYPRGLSGGSWQLRISAGGILRSPRAWRVLFPPGSAVDPHGVLVVAERGRSHGEADRHHPNQPVATEERAQRRAQPHPAAARRAAAGEERVRRN